MHRVRQSINSVAGLLVLIAACTHIALADSATATQQPQCESRAPEFGDERVVTCTFSATGSTQQIAFRVRFLGSHDDTQLSMNPLLNTQPLTCDPGSKTNSRFEDGDITLECRFAVQAKADSTQTLVMGIVWTHAQYGDFEFTVK